MTPRRPSFWTSLNCFAAGLLVGVGVAAGQADSTTYDLVWAREQATVEPVDVEISIEGSDGAECLSVVGSSERASAVPGQLTVGWTPGADLCSARVSTAGLWAPRVAADLDHPDRATIPVYPTGYLRFPLAEVISVEAVPVRFAASQRSSLDQPDDALQGAGVCRRETRELICELPEGILDLTFELPGYAPLFQWEVPVEKGATRRASRLAFVEGSSVTGRVVDRDGEPVEGATIDAGAALGSGFADPEAIHHAKKGRRTATSDAHGFFQVTGLATGGLRLHVRHPDFADFVSSDALVFREPAEVVELGSIELPRLARFEVSVVPAQAPGDQPWRLRLVEAEVEPGARPGDLAGETDDQGYFVYRRVEPRRYHFHVEDGQGSTWFSEPIEVEEGGDSMLVDIPVLEVEGSLLLGDEGTPGSVLLRAGKGYGKLSFQADEEGRFEGFLPVEGWWHPDVQMGAVGDQSLALDPVLIERPSDGRPAEVMLQIPDTRLVGEVVDAEGRPVAGADVWIHRAATDPDVPRPRQARTTQRRTRGDGTFEFRGQPPGHLTLTARHQGKTSGNVMVVLAEDEEPPEQRIVLRGQRDLDGLVISSFGNVAGAQIAAWPDLLSMSFDGFGRTADVAMATADADGAFTVTVPDDLTTLILMVRAPGFGTRLLRHSMDPERVAIVTLDERMGTLIMRGSEPGAATLFVDGIPVSPLVLQSLLRQQFADDPTRIELRGMGSGYYKLCGERGGAEQVLRGQPASACVEGTLVAHGTLELGPRQEPDSAEAQPDDR